MNTDIENKILIVVNYCFAKKGSPRYEDVERCYRYYFKDFKTSPETICRILRRLAEEGILIKTFNRKRVSFHPARPFSVVNPALHYQNMLEKEQNIMFENVQP